MTSHPDVLEVLKSISSYAHRAGETEADTRAKMIDPLLASLGWLPEEIQREPYDDWPTQPGFLDYLLLVHGQPYIALEAKKSAASFLLPERFARGGATTLGTVQKTAPQPLAEAVDQAVRYAEHCGAPYACATNGHQYLFLKPYHRHRPRREAKTIVFSSVETIVSRLDEFEKLLARERVVAGSPEDVLIGRDRIAAEFAKRLNEIHVAGPTRDIESRHFAELADHITRNFLIDIPDDEAFHRCYVEVSWTPTTDDAILALLQNQARSLKTPSPHSEVEPDDVLPQRPLDRQTPRGRSIVLHGAIGIGKSSYLRHLFRRLSRGKEPESIWVRLDLLEYRLRPFQEDTARGVLTDLAARLREQIAEIASKLGRSVDPEEWRHLRDIYNREASRFHKERYPESDDLDAAFINALRDYIFKLKESDPREHFVRTVTWITQQCQVPVVIALDNSDQLGLDFQEYLYDLAALLDQRTDAVTILCLRTEALLSHKIRDNALARIEERYEISRPPLVGVLGARLAEVERSLKPDVTKQKDPNYAVAFDRIWALLEALRDDCRRRGPAARLVEISGNGNLRRTLQAVGKVFKTSPKMMDNLVRATARGKPGRLDPAFVLRGILAGGSSRYQSTSKGNLIPNIFAVDKPIREPHTLSVYLLRHIWYQQRSDNAPMILDVLRDLGAAGMDLQGIRDLLNRLRHRDLLATAHMFEELRDEDRIWTTPLGEGILQEILSAPEYYEAVVWDTVIYERDTFEKMTRVLRNQSGRRRYEQLRDIFIGYLRKDDADLRVAYALGLLPSAAWATPVTLPQVSARQRRLSGR